MTGVQRTSEGGNSSPISSSQTDYSKGKVELAVERWRGGDLAKGLFRSRIIRAMVVGSLLGGIGVGILFLVLSAPPAWMIAAVVAGGLVLGLLSQLPAKGYQKMSFEVTSARRLIGKNYDQIIEIDGKKIFLGALPNRFRCAGENLVNKEGVGAVLSVNEPWEREPVGLSLPYSEKDWKELGVTYKEMDVDDHTLLEDKDLHEAADFIHNQLSANKNVYVHCRAGCGRSAMAVAAYLIKYKNRSSSTACSIIKTNRPISTIYKKQERLESFWTSLQKSCI